jgi:hypothetical protein
MRAAAGNVVHSDTRQQRGKAILASVWGMAKVTIAPLLVGLMLLSSCSRTNSLEDARSDIHSAVSLAAEAEIFIDYVRQGRATANFTEGHIQYLTEEVGRCAEELGKPVTDEHAERKLQAVRNELQTLRIELRVVPHEMGNAQALTAVRDRVRAIRRELEAANSSL